MKIILKEKTKVYLLFNILLIMLLLIAYRKILLMHNVMKWDIFLFHYPNYHFISQSFHNKVLPLWNPYLNYGYPQFAQIGTPLWYPSTIIICLLGSSMMLIHFEHVFHLYLAGLFMFIFLREAVFKDYKNKDYISLIGGLVYPFSGFFISGAQDIMLTISAAWTPLSLYLFYRALKSRKTSDFILAGIPLGLIVLGGYPSILFIMGTILIVWYIFYEFYKCKLKINFINILDLFKNYISMIISTFLLSAIIIIPTIQTMTYMTRGKLPYAVTMYGSNSPLNLFTMFIPNYSLFFRMLDMGPNDLLMVNYYTSIFCIIFAIYCITNSKIRNKTKIFFLTVIFLVLSFGVYTFLDELTRNVIPMFNTFKWPGIYRLFFSIFIIILSGIGINYYLENKEDIDFTNLSMKIFKIFGIGLFAFLIIRIVIIANGNGFTALNTGYPDFALVNTNFIDNILSQGVIIEVVIFAYYMISKNRSINTLKSTKIFFIVVLCFELLQFTYADFYNTVVFRDKGLFDLSSTTIADYCNYLDKTKSDYSIKDYNIHNDNYYGNTKIIFNNKLEMGGYNSYLLKKTEDFKNTYTNKIINSNKVFYLTDNIETLQDRNQIISKLNINNNKSLIVIDKVKSGTIYKNNISFKKNSLYSITKLPSLIKRNQYAIDLKINIKDKNLAIAFLDSNNKVIEQSPIQLTGLNELRYTIPSSCRYIKMNCYKSKIYKSRVVKLSDDVQGDNLDKNIRVNAFFPRLIDLTITNNKDINYLSILQSNYPGWKATIDGKNAEIQTSNLNFMSIKIPKGKHNVVLRFRPTIFYISAMITIGYVFLLIIFLIRKIILANRGGKLQNCIQK